MKLPNWKALGMSLLILLACLGLAALALWLPKQRWYVEAFAGLWLAGMWYGVYRAVTWWMLLISRRQLPVKSAPRRKKNSAAFTAAAEPNTEIDVPSKITDPRDDHSCDPLVGRRMDSADVEEVRSELDVISALQNLGYARSAAAKAVRQAQPREPIWDFDLLFSLALAKLRSPRVLVDARA